MQAFTPLSVACVSILGGEGEKVDVIRRDDLSRGNDLKV